MKNFKQLRSIMMLAGLFSLEVSAASNIDTTDKYAWSTNSGWLNFNDTYGGVTVYEDHLEGDAWAENVGWVRLGSYTGGGSHTYANSSNTDYGVNHDGAGNLSGYAWNSSVGWINFNPQDSQVTINTSTGEFDGYAWAENVGWIHFKNASPAYQVKRLPSVGLSVSSNTGTEAAATAITITATATMAVTGTQTVQLAVTGTGITNNDYTLSSTTLTIPDGQTTGTVTFTLTNENEVEGNETATLALLNPSAGIVLGTTISQNITLIDSTSNTDNIASGSSTPLYVTLFTGFEGLGTGKITSEPSGVNCQTADERCQTSFSINTAIELIATPDIGSEFASWGGDSDCKDGNLFLTTHRTCKASFQLGPRTLTIVPADEGTISSQPEGISCGSNNSSCAFTVDGGTEITLIATPHTDWLFDGWEGEGCENIITLTQNLTCQPRFSPVPATPANLQLTQPDGNVITQVTLAETKVGQPVIQTITLTNNGLTDMMLSEIILPTGFQLVSPFPEKIAVGTSVPLQVQLIANTEGVYQGNLFFKVNSEPVNYPLSGTVIATTPYDNLQLTQPDGNVITQVTLTDTAVGKPATQTITLTNNGSTEMVLSDLELPAGFSLVSSFPQQIAVGDSVPLQVQLAADAEGVYQGDLSFNVNGEPVTYPLGGTVKLALPHNELQLAQPDGQVTTQITLAETRVGQPITQTMTLTNNSSTEMVLSDLTLPTGFSLVSPLPEQIAVGASVPLQVQLTADTEGVYQSNLSFNINGQLVSYPLNATVTPIPTIPYQGLQLTQPDGRIITEIIPNETMVGQPVTQTIMLTNHSSTEMVLSDFTLPSVFHLVSPYPQQIAVGETVPLQVQLAAETEGVYQGSFSFQVNGELVNYPLRGTITPTIPPNELQLTQPDGTVITEIMSSHTTVGQPVTQTMMLANQGTTEMVLSDFTLPTGFELISPYPQQLAVGASMPLQVQLTANTQGLYQGHLSFQLNGEPVSYPLSGTVTVTPTVPHNDLQLTQPDGTVIIEMRPSETTAGQPITQTIVLTNKGVTDMVLSDLTLPTGFRLVDSFPQQLAVDASVPLQVQLVAHAEGVYQGDLSFNINDKPVSYPLSGTVTLAPSIPDDELQLTRPDGAQITEITPIDTTVGQPMTQTIILTNHSATEMNLTDFTWPPTFRLVNPYPQQIPVGASVPLQIQLAATTEGTYQGHLSFQINNKPVSYLLNGTVTPATLTGPGDELQLTQPDGTVITEIAPSYTVVGQPITQTVVLTNNSAVNMRLSDFTWPPGFQLVNPYPHQIGVGKLVPLQLQLVANAPGLYQGNLSFKHNDKWVTYPLSSTVTLAPIMPHNDLQLTQPDGTVLIEMMPTYATVGQPATQTIILTNHGPTEMMLSELKLPTGFRLVGLFPEKIAVGASVQLQLQLLAETEGVYQGHFSFNLNGQLVSYPLSGTVTPMTSLYSSIPAPGRLITLGNSEVGKPTIATPLIIQEIGDTTLEVMASEIVGEQANEFQLIQGAPPFSIADGGLPQALLIQCLPKAAGLRTANLILTTNEPTYTHINYPLICLGENKLDITPTPNMLIDFGATAIDTPIHTTLKLATTGEKTLKILSAKIIGTDADVFQPVNTNLPFSLNANNAADLVLKCRPPAASVYSALLELTTNVPNYLTITYPLTCLGKANVVPRLAAIPPLHSTLNLGTTPVDTPVTGSILFQATDKLIEKFQVTGMNLIGHHADDFSVIYGLAPFSLSQEHPEQVMIIQCRPRQHGTRHALLTLTSPQANNTPNYLTITYSLTCFGEPNALPQLSSIPAPDGTLDFGTTLINTTVTRDLLFQATEPLVEENQIVEMSITGNHAYDFSVISGAPPFSISTAHLNAVMNIQCRPSQIGPRNAQLTLTTAAPNSVNLNYTLHCTGQSASTNGENSQPNGGESGSNGGESGSHGGGSGNHGGGSGSHDGGSGNHGGGSDSHDGGSGSHGGNAGNNGGSNGGKSGLNQEKIIFRGEMSTEAGVVGKNISINEPEKIKITGFIQPIDSHLKQLADLILTYHWTPVGGETVSMPMTVARQVPLTAEMDWLLFEGYLIGLAGHFELKLGYRLNSEEFYSGPIAQLQVLPNRKPTDILLGNNTVEENSPVGTVIGSFTTVDPDKGDWFFYGLTENPGDYFIVKDNELQVANGIGLNYKNSEGYPITVRSVDASGHYLDKNFTIQITDASATLDNLRLTNKYVLEQSIAGTKVARLITEGREQANYEYELIDDAEGRFQLQNDILLVTDGQALDFETQTTHDITVRSRATEVEAYIEETLTIELINRVDIAVIGEIRDANDLTLSTTTLSPQQPVKVIVHLTPDAEHQGQEVEMMSVVFYFQGERLIGAFALNEAQQWQLWDGNFRSLPSYQRRVLPKKTDSLLHHGRFPDNFAGSQLAIYAGYRLVTTGELIYSPQQVMVISFNGSF